MPATINKVCKCGEPVEWVDEFCQMCWEARCSSEFWLMARSLPPVACPMGHDCTIPACGYRELCEEVSQPEQNAGWEGEA